MLNKLLTKDRVIIERFLKCITIVERLIISEIDSGRERDVINATEHKWA